jgi:hypothetical protein
MFIPGLSKNVLGEHCWFSLNIYMEVYKMAPVKIVYKFMGPGPWTMIRLENIMYKKGSSQK